MDTLYGFIVYKCGIQPDYFLDEMSAEEVEYLLKAWYDDYKERMELFRMNALFTISPHIKDKLKPEDLMKFSWDDKDNGKKAVSKEDMEKARERLRAKYLGNKAINKEDNNDD